MPASKLNGRTARILSLDAIPRYVETIELPAITLAWLSITPLGLPVEPDVYKIAARSFSMACSRGHSAGGNAQRSSNARQGIGRTGACCSDVTTTNCREGICARRG